MVDGEDMNNQETIKMIEESSNLAIMYKAEMLTNAAVAYQKSNALSENVEFWKWMDRNYSSARGHMFSSNKAMNNYIAQGKGKSDWVYKQLQGKGYEWDWMMKQRHDPHNLFKSYSAGDISNQPGFDVVEKSLITNNEKYYQMKAYVSKANPDLHNTDKSITVVTNAEKVDVVRNNGYDVEAFGNRNDIIEATDSRMDQIREGNASPDYQFKNVGGAMAKAGVLGCVIGMGTETIVSYQKWKANEISDDKYIEEILKAGGEAGLTAATSTGLMVPITAKIVAAGVSSWVTIPVAVVIDSAVNHVVAPCFGRGKYRVQLEKAKYYQHMEMLYDDFLQSIENAAKEYEEFTNRLLDLLKIHNELKRKDQLVNAELKELYDSI